MATFLAQVAVVAALAAMGQAIPAVLVGLLTGFTLAVRACEAKAAK